MVKTGHRFPPGKVLRLSKHLAGETMSRLGPKHPIVSGSLDAFGQVLRVQIVVPPAVEEGASLSIRKYVSRILDVGEIGFLEGRQVSSGQGREGSKSGTDDYLEVKYLCLQV